MTKPPTNLIKSNKAHGNTMTRNSSSARMDHRSQPGPSDYNLNENSEDGGNGKLPEYSESPMESSSKRAIDIRPGDIVIALMGITGSGKSTFISHFADGVPIGHDLESCTSSVAIYEGRYDENTKIYFVDTPGFDDTYKSDSSILREIADWLSEAYGNNIKLTGIVYLHRILDVRLGGSAMKNLRMFKKLCGDNALQSVVLATTWWSKVDEHTGKERERQLATREDFWAGMLSKGSRMFRQDRKDESAREIVDYLVRKKNPVILNIQKEMVDGNKTLDETSAGIEVDTQLAEQKRQFEAQLAQLQKEMKETMQKKDADFKEELDELRKESAEVHKKMKQAEEDRANLHKNREELRAEMEMQLEIERSRLMQQLQASQEEMRASRHQLDMMGQKFESDLKKQELQFNLEKERERCERLELELHGRKKGGGCAVM